MIFKKNFKSGTIENYKSFVPAEVQSPSVAYANSRATNKLGPELKSLKVNRSKLKTL